MIIWPLDVVYIQYVFTKATVNKINNLSHNNYINVSPTFYQIEIRTIRVNDITI